MTVEQMRSCAEEVLVYFMQTMPDMPFAKEDIIIEFATRKDMVNYINMLCEKHFPEKIISENQAHQLSTVIEANALMGREKSAVVVCINHKLSEQELRSIMFHELMHIYCVKTEIDGEHFIDIYGTGHTKEKYREDKLYDGYLNSGYQVWTEFIAQYYALTKTEEEPFSFFFASDYIIGNLSEVHSKIKDDVEVLFAMACAYLLACTDFDDMRIAMREPNFIFSDDAPCGKETRETLVDCVELLCKQLQKEKPWKINEEFISTVGAKFFMFKMYHSLYSGNSQFNM